MKIVIEVTDKTAAEIRELMKDAEWPEDDMESFCLFLLRNALSQVSTLKVMRDKYNTPPTPGEKN